jgi:hypothetical protein
MYLAASIVALILLVAADAAEKGNEGRKLTHHNLLRRHRDLQQDIKEAEEVNATAGTELKVRYSGRRRALQKDVFFETSMAEMSMLMMSLPTTEMSMNEEVDAGGNEDATAVTTTMATMTPEEDDTPPGFSVQSIHCTWQEGFEKYLLKPRKACRLLNDSEHTEPYLCDGAYENVCCTVSDIENPKMQIFGTCNKFGDAMVRERIHIFYTHF